MVWGRGWLGHGLSCKQSGKVLSSFAYVMQVSDREYQAQRPTTRERLRKAQDLIAEGKGDIILFRCGPEPGSQCTLYWHPADFKQACKFAGTTMMQEPLSVPPDSVPLRAGGVVCAAVLALRFSSSCIQVICVERCRDGDDDMFSSDFSDEELQVTPGPQNAYQIRSACSGTFFAGLQAKLRPVSGKFPTLIVMGGRDECVPKSVDAEGLGRRLVQAIGSKGSLAYIKDGDHSLDGCEDQLLAAMQVLIQDAFGLSKSAIKPPYLYSCT